MCIAQRTSKKGERRPSLVFFFPFSSRSPIIVTPFLLAYQMPLFIPLDEDLISEVPRAVPFIIVLIIAGGVKKIFIVKQGFL